MIGKSLPHRAWVRCRISSHIRKWSAYLSVRPWFEIRDRFVCGSEPWQKWKDTKSKPASFARRAAWPKHSTMFSYSSVGTTLLLGLPITYWLLGPQATVPGIQPLPGSSGTVVPSPGISPP